MFQFSNFKISDLFNLKKKPTDKNIINKNYMTDNEDIKWEDTV